jgi:hypothetical protein
MTETNTNLQTQETPTTDSTPEIQIFEDDQGLKYTKQRLFESFVYMSTSGMMGGGDTGFGGDGGLNPGMFTRNPNGWNIQKACQWIHANSSSNSQHQCAKFVRMAIEAGGVPTTGRPGWAWQYINYLPKIGFKFLDKVDRSYIGTKGKYTPSPGDIAVYTKGGDTSVPGHICMWTGAAWTSDFKQRSMIVYGNTQQAYIFRFV